LFRSVQRQSIGCVIEQHPPLPSAQDECQWTNQTSEPKAIVSTTPAMPTTLVSVIGSCSGDFNHARAEPASNWQQIHIRLRGRESPV
jgi:hypothetical protein